MAASHVLRGNAEKRDRSHHCLKHNQHWCIMGLRILEFQLLLRKGFYLKSNLYSKDSEGL